MVQLKEFKLFAAFILALSLFISCNTEDIIEPVDPTSKYVTIPVSFNLSTLQTKVSLNYVPTQGINEYQFENGDVLYFSNATYGISGYVVYDASAGAGRHWNGMMKYDGRYDFDTYIKGADLIENTCFKRS